MKRATDSLGRPTRLRGARTGIVVLLALAFALAAPLAATADLTPDVPAFMPYPDGYQFANYAGAADWELYEDVFGGRVHWWSIADNTYYRDVFAKKYGGYVCYGFAATAGIFYRDVFGNDPAHYAPDVAVTWDIPQVTRTAGEGYLDEAIERHISKYYYYQYSPDIRATRRGGYNAEHAGELVDFVEAELEAGWDDPWVLCMFGPGYGHAVNILGIERTDTGAIIKVYNNNSPDDRVDPPEVREFIWTPEGFTWGTRDITAIEIRPTSAHERDYIDKWWGDPDFASRYILVSRSLLPDVLVLHTDELGRRFGRTAGAIFNEIPEAEEVVALTGGPDSAYRPPADYYLPLGDYTVDLMGSGDLAYQMFAGDALISVRTRATGPSAARISTLAEQGGFTLLGRDGTQAMQASLVNVLSAERERSIELTVTAPVDSSISVTPTIGVDAYNISAQGMSAAAFDLKLTEASPSGPITATVTAVPMPEGASLVVEPWDWSRLAQMPVYVRVSLPDGEELLHVYNATPANLDELLDDMCASGAIPNRGIATSIRKQIARAPLEALENHLASLVFEGVLPRETADLILATAEVAAADSRATRLIR
jgi:hypothetical protein